MRSRNRSGVGETPGSGVPPGVAVASSAGVIAGVTAGVADEGASGVGVVAPGSINLLLASSAPASIAAPFRAFSAPRPGRSVRSTDLPSPRRSICNRRGVPAGVAVASGLGVSATGVRASVALGVCSGRRRCDLNDFRACRRRSYSRFVRSRSTFSWCYTLGRCASGVSCASRQFRCRLLNCIYHRRDIKRAPFPGAFPSAFGE